MNTSDWTSEINPRASSTDALNGDCRYIHLCTNSLRCEVRRDLQSHGLCGLLATSRPNLFAALPMFVSRAHVDRMARIIHAIEAVVAHPAYRDTVLDWAPAMAQIDPGTKGVFLSYDFRLVPSGPQLVEINTNAGGALLNTVLARVQRNRCGQMKDMTIGPVSIKSLEDALFDMFVAEWRRVMGGISFRRVAIVEANPTEQSLYPECILFQELFRRNGVEAIIADPRELTFREGMLWRGDFPIELVYNRWTDFYFDSWDALALQQAYYINAAVITPHPRAHALYANKRNLTLLMDPSRLRSWGIDGETIDTLLSGIARTEVATPANAERLWADRRSSLCRGPKTRNLELRGPTGFSLT